jgi:hypothetical protein
VAGGSDSLTQLEPLSRGAPLPCSFAQERIWRSANSAEDSAGFLVRSVTALSGPLDLDALRAALEHCVARHEALRTTFVAREDRPYQVVHPPDSLNIPLTDVSDDPDPESAATQLLRDEESARFDLEHGPLLRFRLVRVAENDHRLLRVSHHLLTDRRSWQIFVTDAIEAYDAVRNGRPLPPPEPLQYGDFAAWERQRMTPTSAHCREQIAWWRHAFDRAPSSLQLPFARAVPAAGLLPEDGELVWGLDPAVIDALDRLRAHGGTRYTIRLAIFAALLSLETDQDEVTVGTYIDNRRLAETQSMFGDFSNLMTLILPLDPAATLLSWIRKVRFLVAEARQQAELPYGLLCDELRNAQSTPPEVNVLFAFIRSLPELPCGDIELVPATPPLVTMPWGFTFRIDQGRERDGCRVLFDANRYDPASVRRFTDRYARFADEAAAHPDRPLADLHAALP